MKKNQPPPSKIRYIRRASVQPCIAVVDGAPNKAVELLIVSTDSHGRDSRVERYVTTPLGASQVSEWLALAAAKADPQSGQH